MYRQFLFLFLIFSLSLPLRAGVYHDPALNWQTLESEHFYLHFHQGAEELSRRFAPQAERIYDEISGFLNWYPESRTHVVLTDEYDVSNGFASVFPRNTIVLYLAAPDNLNSLEDHLGWLESVFTHEYLHIVHLDKRHSAPAWMQSILGRGFFLFPNSMQPSWLIEGLATYAETKPGLGIGRGQSSYFDMYMRMEVAAGVKPLRQVNQPISSWPSGHTPYLYGVNFYNFIRDRYGEERIKLQVEDLSGNSIPYRILSNMQHSYGRDIDTLWGEFVRYLEERYRPVLKQIERRGLREGQRLSHNGYFAGPLRSDGRDIYYYAYDSASHPVIRRLGEEGREKGTIEVHNGARLDLLPQVPMLLAQPEVCRNARLYYDLYAVAEAGGTQQRLTRCGRYRYAVWSADGQAIYAVHNELGQNRLLRLDSQGKVEQTLWQGLREEQVGYLSRSPDGRRLVMSIWRPEYGWDLALYDLQAGRLEYLTADVTIQAHPVFTPDGRAILFSADYDGIYNIYRLQLAGGSLTKLSNVRGGAFYPLWHKGALYYVGYTADGFDLYRLEGVQAEPVLPVASPVPLPVATTDEGPSTAAVEEYSALQSLGFTWWLPYINSSAYRSEWGITTSTEDVLKRHSISTTLAYDAMNQLWLGDITYHYDGWYPGLDLSYSRDHSLYLQADESIGRIRRNEVALAHLEFPLYRMESAQALHLAAFSEYSSDIYLDSGVSALADSHNDMLALAWRYNSSQRYPRSISRTDGRELRLLLEDSVLWGSSDNPGRIYVADWREFVPLGGRRVLALRYVEGRGEGNPTDFQLGGVQGQSDLLAALLGGGGSDPLFNVRRYTLRGYNEGKAALAGRNMRLLSAELRSPLMTVERGWMAPPLGLQRLNATLFYDMGGVGTDATAIPGYYAGVGAELNAELDLLYTTRMQLSLGYAQGLDAVEGDQQFYLLFGIVF